MNCCHRGCEFNPWFQQVVVAFDGNGRAISEHYKIKIGTKNIIRYVQWNEKNLYP